MIKEVEMKAFIYVQTFEFRKSVHDVSIQISIARAEQPRFMPSSACESGVSAMVIGFEMGCSRKLQAVNKEIS